MSRLTLLTNEQQTEFENPPHFTNKQRRTFFAISDETKRTISRLQSKINKICFLVQFAYFKACQQFFNTDQFLLDDINYAAKLLGYNDFDRGAILNTRLSKTIRYHRKRILDILDYHPFDCDAKQWLYRFQNHGILAIDPQ